MAHITLSIPDTVYKEMKFHPEIKWSEVARQSIIQKTILLKPSMNSNDFLALLPKETQKSMTTYSGEKTKEYYQKVKEKEWKRKRYLIQA